MNQEDLILAAALRVGLTFELPPTKLFDFANLIRALEREECAKVCERMRIKGSEVFAAAIRRDT